MYRTIAFEKVHETLERLEQRIKERFPDRGLLSVCHELLEIANETTQALEKIERPNYWLRGGITFVILTSLILIGYSISMVEMTTSKVTFTEVIQVAEAAVNDVVLIGLAMFFLISIESRIKRTRVLKSLNQLRAITHVIDMHQLTKDPTEIKEQHNTPSSPVRDLDQYLLSRYLDYSSEMLSIVGKISAVYAQKFPESEVVSAVNEIESLTNGVSRKIWQKIMILRAS